MNDFALSKQLSFGCWRRLYVDGGHVQPDGKSTQKHNGVDFSADVLLHVAAVTGEVFEHVNQRARTYPGRT